ncbi:MAG: hypothetical protein RMY30_030110 [Nostoc sp. CmiSLP01]|nr:hypothetical protein [Nostoc sp. CmiSLP01]MDZ8289007.1 hypothetical protein [Nostoc sp. ChiSLP01]
MTSYAPRSAIALSAGGSLSPAEAMLNRFNRAMADLTPVVEYLEE